MTDLPPEPSIESLVDELLVIERAIDAIDMSLYEGSGCAPPEYTELVGRSHRVTRAIVGRGAVAVPTLMTLSAQRADLHTSSLIEFLIGMIQQGGR